MWNVENFSLIFVSTRRELCICFTLQSDTKITLECEDFIRCCCCLHRKYFIVRWKIRTMVFIIGNDVVTFFFLLLFQTRQARPDIALHLVEGELGNFGNGIFDLQILLSHRKFAV